MIDIETLEPIKIPRPKRPKIETEIPQQQVEEEVNGSNIDELIEKTVDWKDIDPEKLVEILFAISKIIADDHIYPYQVTVLKRMFRSVIMNDGEIITILISRQAGKSFAVALAIVTMCVVLPKLGERFEALNHLKKGMFVGIYAPSAHQANELYLKVKRFAKSEQIRSVYEDPDIDTDTELHGAKWLNGSRVIQQSAAKSSKVESTSFHLLIVDEAQDMDGEVFEFKLTPMVAHFNGSIVMSGTVKEFPGIFYKTINTNNANDIHKPDIFKCNIFYDYIEVQQHNKKYKAHVDGVIKKWGKDSKYFRMAYGCEWIIDEQGTVTYPDLVLYTMQGKHRTYRYSEAPVIVGIDLGSVRNATVATAVAIRNKDIVYDDGVTEKLKTCQILDWFEIEKTSYIAQRPLLLDFIKGYPNCIKVVVDNTGVGRSVFEEMQREWNLPVEMIPFNFNPKSKHELTNLFFEWFWRGRIDIPSDEFTMKQIKFKKFVQQITTMRKRKAGQYSFLTKTDENSYDDYPDSFFLALYGIANYLDQESSVEIDRKLDYTTSTIDNIRHRMRTGNYSLKNHRANRITRLMNI